MPPLTGLGDLAGAGLQRCRAYGAEKNLDDNAAERVRLKANNEIGSKIIGRSYVRMQPIDQRFRFTLDICIVWVLLVIPTFILTHNIDIGPWYSYVAILIVVPLFGTFVLFGPVLLIRQVIRSGSRGRFVARIFLSILLVAILLFGGLFLSGLYTERRARILAFIFIAIATAYLGRERVDK
jgi:hypothetical protein